MSEKDDDFEPADLPEDEEEKREQKKKGAAAKVFSEISAANSLDMDSTQFIAYSLAGLIVAINDSKSYADLKARIAPHTDLSRAFIANVDLALNRNKGAI